MKVRLDFKDYHINDCIQKGLHNRIGNVQLINLNYLL